MSAQPPLPPAAVAALHRGSKIEAIKIYREEHRVGLKEAKDAIDEYVRTQPTLEAKFTTARSDAKRTLIRWFLAFVLVYLVFSMMK